MKYINIYIYTYYVLEFAKRYLVHVVGHTQIEDVRGQIGMYIKTWI